MAMPSRVVTTEEAWTGITGTHDRAVRNTERLRATSAVGPTELATYENLQKELDRAVNNWASWILVDGLQQYARGQVSKTQLNTTQEHAVMRSTAIALRDWIFANIDDQLGSKDISGTRIAATISTADTVEFRALADAFIATIE